MQITCTCGEKYWPSQKWIHEKCVSQSVSQTASNTMANEATNNMANASNESNASNTYKYRDVEKRRAYQREYMRKVRAK
jgi:hypothetical protein